MDNTVIYYGLPILGLAITSLAQLFITSSYSKYKEINTKSSKPGCDIAREILNKNGLRSVNVEQVSGNLTDHYDPKTKTVRLSTDIYTGTSIASASVAAHECGHAIQDKEGYTPMIMRSKLVPIVNFATRIGYIVIAISLILGAINLTRIGIIMLLSMLLFQLITLPVEFDASNRGKRELRDLSILNNKEQSGASTMLKAAAFTYVASVLSTILEILRLFLIFSSRRNRN